VVDEATGETRRETRPVLENVASYIDWEGNVLHRYKKRNLWWPEKEYLCEGNEDHQVFDTRFGRVGMLICASPSPSASLCLVPNTAGTDLPRALPAAGWDLAWPRAFQSLLLQNVSLVLAPTYWTAVDAGPLGLKHNVHSEADYLKVLIPTRAWDNECAIVVRWPPALSRLLLAALRSTVHGRAQQGVKAADVNISPRSSPTRARPRAGTRATLSGTKRAGSAGVACACRSRVGLGARYVSLSLLSSL